MISHLKRWINRKRVYNQTYKELNSLTDFELRDLGLTRDMIPVIAHEATYGKDSSYV